MDVDNVETWDRRQIMELIRLYEECPCLWNPNDPNFNHKLKRRQKLHFILKNILLVKPDITITMIQKKLRILLKQFNRENERVSLLTSTGDSSERMNTRRLWCYDQLSFLNNIGSKSMETDEASTESMKRRSRHRKERTRVTWMRKQTTTLIKSFKKHQLLWDPDHPDYTKNYLREAAYKDISIALHNIEFDVPMDCVKAKMRTLRNQYKKQVDQILSEQKRFGVAKQPTLWAFYILGFLWPICAKGATLPTFVTEDENDDTCQFTNDNEFLQELDDTSIVEETENLSIETIEDLDLPMDQNEDNIAPNIDEKISTARARRKRSLKWDRVSCRKLIQMYKHNALLWNPSMSGYDNFSNRDPIYNKIANVLGVTPEDVQTKLHTIRTQYCKQLRDLAAQEQAGEKQSVKLWCFNLLRFLWPICKKDDTETPYFSGDDVESDNSYDNDEMMQEILSQSNSMTTGKNPQDQLESLNVELLDDLDEPKADVLYDIDEEIDDFTDVQYDSVEIERLETNQDTGQVELETKTRFTWLGDAVVKTLNKIYDEDAVYEAVMNIRQILAKLEKDGKEHGTTNVNILDADCSELEDEERRDHKRKPKPPQSNTFEVNYDVSLFDYGELSVKISNNTIIIEGEHVGFAEEDPLDANISHHFLRHYELPFDYDKDTIAATLSADGMLEKLFLIRAPLAKYQYSV